MLQKNFIILQKKSVSASGFEKRIARNLFSISYKQLASGITSRRARPKFLLG